MCEYVHVRAGALGARGYQTLLELKSQTRVSTLTYRELNPGPQQEQCVILTHSTLIPTALCDLDHNTLIPTAPCDLDQSTLIPTAPCDLDQSTLIPTALSFHFFTVSMILIAVVRFIS